MPVIVPPMPIQIPEGNRSIFLAGSIEMGKATDWQTQVIVALDSPSLTMLNPRRPDWDATWQQHITNPVFKEQVLWELEGLERADVIVMYFDPHTQSPITLLELGLHAQSGKLIVCCPEGFWRKGNIDILCEKYSITQLPDLQTLINTLSIKYK